jgi:DNA primase large subunit
MLVGVQGSQSFNEYAIFLRAMAVAMSSMEEGDTEFFIYSAGPSKINSFVAEFSNITERSLKSKGIKIRFFRVPPSWISDNIHDINYFVYLSKPKEPTSKLAALAERKGIEVGVFRY